MAVEFDPKEAAKFRVVLEKHATNAFKEEQKAILAIIKALDPFLQTTFGVQLPDEDRKRDINPLLDALEVSPSARHFLAKAEFKDRPFLYWRLGFWFNHHDGRSGKMSGAMVRHQTALSTVRLVFKAPQESWDELLALCCSESVSQRRMKDLGKEKNGGDDTDDDGAAAGAGSGGEDDDDGDYTPAAEDSDDDDDDDEAAIQADKDFIAPTDDEDGPRKRRAPQRFRPEGSNRKTKKKSQKRRRVAGGDAMSVTVWGGFMIDLTLDDDDVEPEIEVVKPRGRNKQSYTLMKLPDDAVVIKDDGSKWVRVKKTDDTE